MSPSDVVWQCQPCGFWIRLNGDDLPPLCVYCKEPLLFMKTIDSDGVDVWLEKP